MWPRTREGEQKHRKRKREREGELIVKEISQFLTETPNSSAGRRKNHEIWWGEGHQLPFLKTLGDVVALDLHPRPEVPRSQSIPYFQGSILNAPFQREEFDLIFSNHALEHLEDLPRAFEELKRIGKRDCLYAFSVPTPLWLLLSIPAQYYIAARVVFRKLRGLFQSNGRPSNNEAEEFTEGRPLSGKEKWLYYFFPRGHGIYSRFTECYRAFKVKNWEQLFLSQGLRVLKTQPLLLYAPSEWPIVPTTPLLNRFHVSSSVLFLLRKGG